jgi:hypothetical protein
VGSNSFMVQVYAQQNQGRMINFGKEWRCLYCKSERFPQYFYHCIRGLANIANIRLLI